MSETDPPKSHLSVRPGVDPSKARPRPVVKKRKTLSLEEYEAGIRANNRVVIGRAFSLMESVNPKHREMANELLGRLMKSERETIRLGISGIPGVGKSTFIEAFGCHAIEQGKKVAVLAVDPSSSKTGGSILGDKTRMEKLAMNENALVRPSAAGNWLGGVARASRESTIVCEAAGYDLIIIETVGVGQSETQAASMVDFFLVLMIAGAGDELQGIKRGILEMADTIAINKADGDNIDRSRRAKAQFQSALRLLRSPTDPWQPCVQTCSALTGDGIAEIYELITGHHDWARDTGHLKEIRRGQARYWMNQSLDQLLRSRFFGHPAVKADVERLTEQVLEGSLSPFLAAEAVVTNFFPEVKPDS